MRLVFIFLLYTLLFLFTKSNYYPTSSPPPSPSPRKDFVISCRSSFVLLISVSTALKILFQGFLLILLLLKLFIHTSSSVKFVKFQTNLSMMHKIVSQEQNFLFSLVVLFYAFLLSEINESWYILLLYSNVNVFSIKFHHSEIIHLRKMIILLIVLYIFHLSDTIQSEILCLIIFQNYCYFFVRRHSWWLIVILLILANDINPNPGPPNSYFSFMSWNCNSIAKDDFHRLRLLEVENSIHNYDLISLYARQV